MRNLFTTFAVLFAALAANGQGSKNLVRSYPTPAAMCSNTPASSEYFAVVGRYTNNNDGFIAQFVPGSVQAANGYSVFQPTNASSGRWIRLAMPGSLLEGIGAGGVNVQVFTNAGSYTWTKPTNALAAYVMVVGGGGGGWGGAVANIDDSMTFLDMFSGEGGAGGGWSERYFYAAELPSTVPVHVGAGGTGGAGSTISAQGGVNGDPATDSYFGTSAETNYVFAAAAGPYYDTPGTGQFPGSSGIVGSHDYGYVTANVIGLGKQATGGGAGGSLANDLIIGTGEGSGVYSSPGYGYRFTGRATWSQNGTNGASFGLFSTGMGGGGGGGANIDIMLAANAGHGANGGWPGGGGGGGGLGLANVGGKLGNGGNGGDGADGFVGVVTLIGDSSGGGSGGAGLTDLIGDGTASGPGIGTLTLAATGVTNGVYGSASLVPQFSVDSKGRILGVTNRPVENFYSIDGSFTSSRYVNGNLTNGLVFQNMQNIVAGATDALYLFSGNSTVSGNNLVLFAYDAYMNIGSVYSNLLSTSAQNVLMVDPTTTRVDFKPIVTRLGSYPGQFLITSGSDFASAMELPIAYQFFQLTQAGGSHVRLPAGIPPGTVYWLRHDAGTLDDIITIWPADGGEILFSEDYFAFDPTSIQLVGGLNVMLIKSENAETWYGIPNLPRENSAIEGAYSGSTPSTTFGLSHPAIARDTDSPNKLWFYSADDGNWHEITSGGSGGATVNSTDGYAPFRISATTFGNSALYTTGDNWYLSATNSLYLRSGNSQPTYVGQSDQWMVSSSDWLPTTTKSYNIGGWDNYVSTFTGCTLRLGSYGAGNTSEHAYVEVKHPGTNSSAIINIATSGDADLVGQGPSSLLIQTNGTTIATFSTTGPSTQLSVTSTAGNAVFAVSGGGHPNIIADSGKTIHLSPDGASYSWWVTSTGLLTDVDGTKDIGASNHQVKDLYIKGAVKFDGGTIIDAYGSGSPEGAVTGSVGSTYRRTDGGAGTSFYVKESGSGNTGWVGK